MNELDHEVKSLRKELNTERTQRVSVDESLGMRFDNLIFQLDTKYGGCLWKKIKLHLNR